jgi:hypothetical protein
MVVRFIELALLIFNWIILCCATKDFIAEFKYLTIWGMLVTLISVVLSFGFCKDAKEPVMIGKPNSFLALWKWYIFFFELAISLEIVIAPYFWAFLWGAYTGKVASIEELNLVLCHSVSIAILLLEFSMINALPIILKHYSAIFAIIVLYMIDNVIFVKVTGKAVYPGITWDSVSGCLLPVAVFVVSIIFYIILSCLSKPKMTRINKR